MFMFIYIVLVSYKKNYRMDRKQETQWGIEHKNSILFPSTFSRQKDKSAQILFLSTVLPLQDSIFILNPFKGNFKFTILVCFELCDFF